MSKVVDITDKLSFDTNPVLKVKNESFEVQSDAETVLKIMGLFNGEKNEMEAATEAVKLLFDKEDQKRLMKMKLSFKDYMILIKQAIDLAAGNGEESGEQ